MFTTAECAWSNTSLKMLNSTIKGLLGFEFDIEIENEFLYGAGSKAIDINEGNEKNTGLIKCLSYEVFKMTDAAQAANYVHLAKVPHDLVVITCAFKKRATDPIRIIEAQGVKFHKLNFKMDQNAKSMPIDLPFMAMKIDLRKG